MARTKTYRAELTNPGSGEPREPGFINSYDFVLEFGAYDKDDAIDTVSAILDGHGMIMPPQGTRFQLYRLIDKASGKVVLE